MDTTSRARTRGAANYPLGTIEEIAARSNCQICSLITQGIARYSTTTPKDKPIYMRLDCVEKESSLSVFDNPRFLDFSKEVLFGSTSSPWKIQKQKTVALNIYPKTTPDNGDWVLARSMSSKIDINLLKLWISKCELERGLGLTHSVCQIAKPSGLILPTEFKLVDVRLRVIVDAPKNPRFMALSYVWGKSTDEVFRLSKKHAEEAPKNIIELPSGLPQAIEDAIRLVRDLGERYLWIDALCIIQDDPDHLSRQINAMSDIYGLAYVTIVSASGYSFPCHLPGYSDIPRSPHLLEGRIGNRELCIRLGPTYGLFDGISRSPWKNRAWTYQECLLSQRRLIFTNQEVYFSCLSSIYAESCTESAYANTRPTIPRPVSNAFADGEHGWLHGLFYNSILMGGGWDFNSFIKIVHEYLSRDISYNADGYNAFKGIEHRLHTASGVPFFWGLPEGEYFLTALMWKLKRPLTSGPPRPGFPSWSWLGWFKEPIYSYLPSPTYEPMAEVPAYVQNVGVEFRKETLDGELELIDTRSKPGYFYRRPRQPFRDFKPCLHVISLGTEFEVRAAGSLEADDWHLYHDSRLCGPAKFARISSRDITRKLANRKWFFLLIAETLPWVADGDMRNITYLERLKDSIEKTTGKPGSEALLRGSEYLKHKLRVKICNTMVLEVEQHSAFQMMRARCVAMCDMEEDVWYAGNPEGGQLIVE